MRRLTTVLAGILLCSVSPLRAQTSPPATDVYLVPLDRADSAWEVGAPANLTSRPGYDNQPAFTPDGGHVLYTSYREGQADVWRVELPGGPTESVTRTAESEYSPTPSPSGGFTVVRVEADSTQRLWRFTEDGEPVEPTLEQVEPVGYHAWLDDRRVVVYVLGDPSELRVADVETGEVWTVARDVGRSLQSVPGGGVSFVRRGGERGEEAWLHRLLPDGRATERLTRLPGDRVDHAWGPDGTVWTGVAGDLWAWHPEQDPGRGFSRVASLGRDGLIGITRVAVSPDGRWLAVVASDPADGG